MGGSYFERHWRGELSLAASYWLNHALLGTIGSVLLTLAAASVLRTTGDVPLACLGFTGALLILWAGLQIWQIAGTWRAAAHARQVRRTRWAGIAQALLCFSVFGSILQTSGILIPIVRAVIIGDWVPIPGTVLRDNGRVIAFSGPVGKTAAEGFRRVLDSANPSVVRLASEGGLVQQARLIAAMIRERDLDTEVSQRCVSACTIIFFAGHRRLISGSGTLGFHSYASPEMTPQAVVDDEARERRSYLAGGVAPDFIDSMFAVPPAKVWYPTRQQAEAAGFASASR